VLLLLQELDEKQLAAVVDGCKRLMAERSSGGGGGGP
jgi:hypothetical protein